MKIADADESDGTYTCRRLVDLEHGARAAYYVAKIVSLAAGL
jgi:hypothetical protein